MSVTRHSTSLDENAECTCLRLHFLLSRFSLYSPSVVGVECLSRSFRSSKAPPMIFPCLSPISSFRSLPSRALRPSPQPPFMFCRCQADGRCISNVIVLEDFGEDGPQRRYHIIIFSGLVQGDGRASDDNLKCLPERNQHASELSNRNFPVRIPIRQGQT